VRTPLLVVLAALTACAQVAGHGSAARTSPGGSVGYGPAPDFTLPNVAGGRFTLSGEAAAHRVVVLTFVTADCREECPKVEAVLRAAARTLQSGARLARSVEIATIELDPATNGLPAVRLLRQRLWPARGWDFLRGSPAETAHVLRDYDVYVEPRARHKDLVHSSYVYIVDDRLRQVDLLALGVNLTSGKLLEAIDAAAAHRLYDASTPGGT